MSAGNATKRKQSGEQHRYYRCSQLVKRAETSDCRTRQVSADALESAVNSLIGLVAKNPAAFARVGFDPSSGKREEDLAKANGELLKLESMIGERRGAIDSFIRYLGKSGSESLADDVREAGLKAKQELAKLEHERIQVEHTLHKITARIPRLSELSMGFSNVKQALEIADRRGQWGIFQTIIRWVRLNRVILAGGNWSANEKQRVFRLEVLFRTDEILNYGQAEATTLFAQEKYADLRLRVTFTIHSNSKEQRVTLMEPNYTITSAKYLPASSPGIAPEDRADENPIQRAIRWKLLITNNEITATALAIDEKVSKALISQHLALLSLPQLIVDFMKDGKDRSLKRKISLRELQRLCILEAADAISAFHNRVSGNEIQAALNLVP
jgi:hypothetical protein